MRLEDILVKAKQNIKLEKDEIKFLLGQTEKDKLDKIFETAREVREQHFGNKLFAYGFVYFSTYCKNNCSFCFYRAKNNKPPRYRKELKEIIDIAVHLKKSGVHMIDLTMGEDPYYEQHPEELVKIVSEVKKATDLPIMVSPGVVPDSVIASLYHAGADWFALYQETHNRELYKTMRLEQDYDVRMHAKTFASQIGLLVEEGLLAGIGDSVEDRLHSFEEMERIGASQVRTMTFIPQEGTPMEQHKQNTFLSELLNIAVMRILFPEKLIPASLDVDGIAGLKERLMAGANVVTSIIPPLEGFMGVAQAETDVDQGFRTIKGISKTIEECGLALSTKDEFIRWIQDEKEGRAAV